MREHFLDQREPVPILPPRFQLTAENPKADLVLYGIPVNVDAIYAIAENHYREKGIPFEPDNIMFYVAMTLINDACGVDHITAHAATCPYDDDRNWVIALYNNRNMTSRQFPDPEKEDRFVDIILKLLRQTDKPPKLWIWARDQECIQNIY